MTRDQIAQCRADVQAGAGHDCGEWVQDGKCQLCDRVIDPDENENDADTKTEHDPR